MSHPVFSILTLLALASIYLLVELSPWRRPWRRKKLCETDLSPRRIAAGLLLASLVVFVTLPLATTVVAEVCTGAAA